MSPPPNKIRTAEDRLRAAGVAFQRLQDVPVKIVRAVNRYGFRDMRSILLPPKTIRVAVAAPLTADLLVTRIGYVSQAAGHYIPRPDGSLDHILHHVVRGRGWLKVADHQWHIVAGTVVALPAGVPHWYGADDDDPWSIYWIHFTGRQAAAYFDFLGVTPEQPLVHLAQTEEILLAFEETYRAMRAVHTRGNLVEASIGLARYLAAIRHAMHAGEVRSRAVEERVRESVEFIARNLGVELSLTELAQLARISVSRYTPAFRRLTGCSPIEYINRLRVQRACELLRNTPESVQNVARRVGFPDPYYFSRAFKKITGVSPAHFRQG